MSSDAAALSPADRCRQFHFQTLKLYTATVAIDREIQGCKLPVPRELIEAPAEFVEDALHLAANRDLLNNFSKVFEEDCVVLPTFNWSSLHEAAIDECLRFLTWLPNDVQNNTDVFCCFVEPVLKEDKLRAEIMLTNLALSGENKTRNIKGETIRFAIVRGSDAFEKMFKRGLRQEVERYLKLFAAESGDSRTIDVDLIEGFVTISDIAALADVEKQTVYNEISKSDKDAPKAAVPGSGRRANKYRYSEILPWLRRTWPYKPFPDSYEEAAAIVARQAAQKVSSS